MSFLVFALGGCPYSGSSTDLTDEVEALTAQVTALQEDLDALQGGGAGAVITDDLVIAVPGTLPDGTEVTRISEVVGWLAGYRIASPATVTIQLSAKSSPYTVDSGHPIRIDHAEGNRIRIVGDTAAPASIVIAAQDISAIEVPNGHALGLVAGVTLSFTGSRSSAGLWAHDNGSITCGTVGDDGVTGSVIIQGFSLGIASDRSSSVRCAGVTITGARRGISARTASAVTAPNATITGSLESGVVVDLGSSADIEGADVSGSVGDGIVADNGSTVYAELATSTANGGSGVVASFNSSVYFGGGTASDNVVDGVLSEYRAAVQADGAIFSGNTLDVEARYAGFVSLVGATLTTSSPSASAGGSAGTVQN